MSDRARRDPEFDRGPPKRHHRQSMAFATSFASLVAGMVLAIWGCGGARARSRVEPLPVGGILVGKATYYSDSFQGRRTANGERYDRNALTAAHRTLPFGTRLRVTTDAGRSVEVRVNDRGPFGRAERILDLSRAAAVELGMIRAGVVRVQAEVIEAPSPRSP